MAFCPAFLNLPGLGTLVDAKSYIDISFLIKYIDTLLSEIGFPSILDSKIQPEANKVKSVVDSVGYQGESGFLNSSCISG